MILGYLTGFIFFLGSFFAIVQDSLIAIFGDNILITTLIVTLTFLLVVSILRAVRQ